ncbi:putative glycolipid transfer protein HET-C2 [Microthyrium microscopicum]|uniref:Putative glycolipid transfer protein HET-C2 n=1 Tax=Microthyrium microscopicum TaxID=703497 RepID=A0A6A6U9E3_9PEZI|nr:putative glycolipid transfer protein HET-C2 [Microthyrium microscopicum]
MFGFGKKSPPKLVVPEGKTFFDTLNHTFDDVPVGAAPDHKIPTEKFLAASEDYVTMFTNHFQDVNNGVVFGRVLDDMTANIQKIRTAYLANPIEGEFLQDLVLKEQTMGLTGEDEKANTGLFWLVRALEFSVQAVINAMNEPDKTLSNNFQTAYAATLGKWHDAKASFAYGLLLKGVPYRKDFIPLLGADEAKLKSQALPYASSMQKVLDTLDPFVVNKIAAHIGKSKNK